MLYSISFDTNDLAGPDQYDLGLPGSLKDIEPIADKLQVGMHVIIYMPNELEIEAILDFDWKLNRWVASPVWNTLKHDY